MIPLPSGLTCAVERTVIGSSLGYGGVRFVVSRGSNSTDYDGYVKSYTSNLDRGLHFPRESITSQLGGSKYVIFTLCLPTLMSL